MVRNGIEYKKCSKCGKLCAKLEMVNHKICKECVIAGLKEDIKARSYAMAMSEKVEKKLRQQIEEMKCCENCSHHRFMGDVLECKLPLDACFELSAWELRK